MLTDEWHAYDDLDDCCQTRFLVNHKRRERARDGDGDGEREVHSNRIDGFWLALRYDLRPCRGVSKWCRDSHLAFDPGTHNDRRDLRGLLRLFSRPTIPEGTCAGTPVVSTLTVGPKGAAWCGETEKRWNMKRLGGSRPEVATDTRCAHPSGGIDAPRRRGSYREMQRLHLGHSPLGLRLVPLVLMVLACSSAPSLDSFEVPPTQCQLQSSVRLSGSALTWTGCRLRYNATSETYTWQLLTPGSSGNWSSPGTGWITLTFNKDSPENASLIVSNTISETPASVARNEVVLVYTPRTGARAGGGGIIEVGSNNVSAPGGSSALRANFRVTLTDGQTLLGEAFAQIAAATSTPGGGGGGGGVCLDNGSRCPSDSLVARFGSECRAGTTSGCYCQAAATALCFGRNRCYAEAGAATRTSRSQLQSTCTSNTQQASALGRSCGFSCSF